MRFIELTSTDPAVNLAAEEWLLRQTDQDVFMLWRNAASVIVGRNQNTRAQINEDFVRQRGMKFGDQRDVSSLCPALRYAPEQQRVGRGRRIAAARAQRYNLLANQFLRAELCKAAVRPRLAARCPHRVVDIDVGQIRCRRRS